MSELRDDLKGSRGSIEGFSNQVDECRRSVAQESRTLADVRDSSGVESHQLRAGCISSNRRIGPGERADGVVLFERPPYKRSMETLFLQMAESGAVDKPALAPIGFGVSTLREAANHAH